MVDVAYTADSVQDRELWRDLSAAGEHAGSTDSTQSSCRRCAGRPDNDFSRCVRPSDDWPGGGNQDVREPGAPRFTFAANSPCSIIPQSGASRTVGFVVDLPANDPRLPAAACLATSEKNGNPSSESP